MFLKNVIKMLFTQVTNPKMKNNKPMMISEDVGLDVFVMEKGTGCKVSKMATFTARFGQK